jgi:hypothetical protein
MVQQGTRKRRTPEKDRGRRKQRRRTRKSY